MSRARKVFTIIAGTGAYSDRIEQPLVTFDDEVLADETFDTLEHLRKVIRERSKEARAAGSYNWLIHSGMARTEYHALLPVADWDGIDVLDVDFAIATTPFITREVAS